MIFYFKEILNLYWPVLCVHVEVLSSLKKKYLNELLQVFC